MDEFKKYIRDKREDMDLDSPPAFRGTAQVTTSTKPARLFYFLRYAAAAAILVGLTLGIKYLLSKKDLPGTMISKTVLPVNKDKEITLVDTNQITVPAPVVGPNRNKKQPPGSTDVDPYELMHSFEANYSELVNLQLNTIRHTPVYGGTTDYFIEFKTSLGQLDNDETLLRKNIHTNGINEVLLEKLIGLYQQKLDLLKSLQAEMNKVNNKVLQSRSQPDSLIGHYINI